MNKNNICKFVLKTSNNNLKIRSFVRENLIPHDRERRMQGHHEMCLVMHGEGEFKGEFFSHKLKTGVLFFSFAGVPFQIDDIGGLQYMFIGFEGDRADELFSRFGVSKSNCVFEGFEYLRPLWEESLLRADEENVDLLGESILLYSFSALKNSVKPCNKVLNLILQATEEEFSNPSFSLNSLSEQLGYNPKYISRLFKKEVGVGFLEYLTNVRMKHAVFLMKQGLTSIKNVALLSGYSDPLYFSKVFKKYMGTTPREYLSISEENQ